MRTVLIITVALLLSSILPSATADAVDFTKIDKLKALVSSDLAVINNYKNERERLVKENQGRGPADAVKPFAATVVQGILNIEMEFERLDDRTTKAKNDPQPSDTEIEALERRWSFLHTESSIYRATLGSTPLTRDAQILMQYRVSFGSKPAEGWHIGSISYFRVSDDDNLRETQINEGCKLSRPPFVRSPTTSAVYDSDELKKRRALLEQWLPPGQKYIWVQDEHCTVRSSPSMYVDNQGPPADECKPLGTASNSCFSLNMTSPQEKPKNRK